MSENPYQSPSTDSNAAVAVDRSKLESDLEKVLKARKYTLLLLPVVGLSTALQYAGIFSAGNLPNWFGLVVIAACVIQLPFLSKKISKLESTLAKS